MTYTRLTTDELVLIESYHRNNISVLKISQYLTRSRQTIHTVVSFFKEGHTALDYHKQYKAKKNVAADGKSIYLKTNLAQGVLQPTLPLNVCSF
ncbi:hypothetical protein BKP56_03070 [Marinilactibacillus sp. 15R]|uniref:Helix-turn-helix domain-containing protein n=1 Tax=Marinilactibacillus piezotolerans TaxID=258723 RepID=A0A1I4C484_9LACT|nr:hypothetical protein BKP56_03070 [Marinilactibacillus sp. 15R]SFK75755.1 hypothetical protein SAMN04488569_10993 [Marinilactibacillus piezotolerans]